MEETQGGSRTPAGGGELAIPIGDPDDPACTVVVRRIDAFSEREASLARTIAGVGSLAIRNAELRHEIDRANLDVIFRLATAAEFRDGETGGHIQRVSLYAETVASKMGVGRDVARRLLFAAPMHDVGKLGVPDAILLKPGPLTDEERAQMQRHTLMGAQVLAESTNPILAMGREIALSHHERWDGTGYPHGLAGESIPLSARIVAVGDVFDALTSRRVYKRAMDLDEAMGLIEAAIGTHFDPNVGRAFLDASSTIASIRGAYAELDGAEPNQGTDRGVRAG